MAVGGRGVYFEQDLIKVTASGRVEIAHRIVIVYVYV